MEYTFISGATGGIGKAFTLELAKMGNNLFLVGRSDEKLSLLKEQVLDKFKNISVETFKCDLCKEDERKLLTNYLMIEGISITKVYNIAGVDIQKAFVDYTYEKVNFQMGVNVNATISLTHFFITHYNVKEILTISSMSGVSPMPYFALYSATKCMLTNFFTSLHYELKEKGVKVTTVLPGGVYTRQDIIEDIKGQGLWGKLSAKTPDYVAKKSIKAINKNKTIYVLGGFNKILYFILKIAPKKIVLKFIKKRWSKQTKDAF